MLVPGGNLLNIAGRVIAFNTVQYRKFLTRDTNEILLDVTTYADPKAVAGSVQAIPRNRYTELGLDFNKNYVNFYATQAIEDLHRDTAGDQLYWAGRTWQALSDTEWRKIDGWQGTIFIDVGPQPKACPC